MIAPDWSLVLSDSIKFADYWYFKVYEEEKKNA